MMMSHRLWALFCEKIEGPPLHLVDVSKSFTTGVGASELFLLWPQALGQGSTDAWCSRPPRSEHAAQALPWDTSRTQLFALNHATLGDAQPSPRESCWRPRRTCQRLKSRYTWPLSRMQMERSRLDPSINLLRWFQTEPQRSVSASGTCTLSAGQQRSLPKLIASHHVHFRLPSMGSQTVARATLPRLPLLAEVVHTRCFASRHLATPPHPTGAPAGHTSTHGARPVPHTAFPRARGSSTTRARSVQLHTRSRRLPANTRTFAASQSRTSLALPRSHTRPTPFHRASLPIDCFRHLG